MKLWFQREVITVPGESHNTSSQTADITGHKSPSAHMGINLVIALFCILEILDALLTYWAVNAGLVWEGNHLVAQMAGNWSFILLKFAGAILSGIILQKLHDHFPGISMVAAVSIAVFYSAVLAWNVSLIVPILIST